MHIMQARRDRGAIQVRLLNPSYLRIKLPDWIFAQRSNSFAHGNPLFTPFGHVACFQIFGPVLIPVGS